MLQWSFLSYSRAPSKTFRTKGLDMAAAHCSSCVSGVRVHLFLTGVYLLGLTSFIYYPGRITSGLCYGSFPAERLEAGLSGAVWHTLSFSSNLSYNYPVLNHLPRWPLASCTQCPQTWSAPSHALVQGTLNLGLRLLPRRLLEGTCWACFPVLKHLIHTPDLQFLAACKDPGDADGVLNTKALMTAIMHIHQPYRPLKSLESQQKQKLENGQSENSTK